MAFALEDQLGGTKLGYPRPQLRRSEWITLDGVWDFSIDRRGGLLHPDQVQWERKILVPFAPETALSGIGDTSFFCATWYRRQIAIPELMPWQIRRDVETNDTRIVVIDSLNGFLMSMPGEQDLNLHLHELLAFLNQKGVVTILIYTQHGLVGSMQTEIDVSYLSDTVVVLRYFEVEGEIRQAISVIKQRVGQHERALRELCMSNSGVEIGEQLTEFRGILTGVPEPLSLERFSQSIEAK